MDLGGALGHDMVGLRGVGAGRKEWHAWLLGHGAVAKKRGGSFCAEELCAGSGRHGPDRVAAGGGTAFIDGSEPCPTGDGG